MRRKTYETLSNDLTRQNERLHSKFLPPHSTNLLHQLSKREAKNLGFYNQLYPVYTAFRKAAEAIGGQSLAEYVSDVVSKTNGYMEFLRSEGNFSHQQDFTSSVIPEMFYFLFRSVAAKHNTDLIVQAQDDVPIECMFTLAGGSTLVFKKKRLDMSLCQEATLSLNGVEQKILIPLMVMEIKTNLDKNMLAGIENSVAALKKTFPQSLYYVVSEFADFDSQKLNYASTDIDEIYIIRKQKRSEVRDGSVARNAIDKDLVLEIVSKVDATVATLTVLSTDLGKRMETGKLIDGK